MIYENGFVMTAGCCRCISVAGCCVTTTPFTPSCLCVCARGGGLCLMPVQFYSVPRLTHILLSRGSSLNGSGFHSTCNELVFIAGPD